MTTSSLIAIPLIAAIIGWGTNLVAVRMLFRPHSPIRILGFTLHGAIPSRQKELARKIGETVESSLISHKDLASVLQSEEINQRVVVILEAEIENFLRTKLSSIPMASLFLQGPMLDQVKQLFMTQFQQRVPHLLDSLMSEVEQKMDFKEIVREKVEQFDLIQLEEIVYQISASELKTIEYLGGLLGFLVGLAQLGVMLILE